MARGAGDVITITVDIEGRAKSEAECGSQGDKGTSHADAA
jgi:flagellar basal body L-ring protein FlgH